MVVNLIPMIFESLKIRNSLGISTKFNTKALCTFIFRLKKECN